MPVPLTTAALAFSAILLGMNAEIPSIIVGTAGVLNQALATWATTTTPAPPPEEY